MAGALAVSARPRAAAAKPRAAAPRLPDETREILRHWQEAVPHDRLAHLVRDASRAFARSLGVRLAAHGVSFGHWTFLRVLWERDGITQKELSMRAGVMEPTTFAAVRAMAAKGYIVRRQHADNRKNVYIHLTPRGRALERTLVPLAEDVNRIGVAGVRSADVTTTRATLLAILHNLARDAADSDPPL
ncbi:MAG: MarR family transcriptional regulator [Burkholderiales bacterium]